MQLRICPSRRCNGTAHYDITDKTLLADDAIARSRHPPGCAGSALGSAHAPQPPTPQSTNARQHDKQKRDQQTHKKACTELTCGSGARRRAAADATGVEGEPDPAAAVAAASADEPSAPSAGPAGAIAALPTAALGLRRQKRLHCHKGHGHNNGRNHDSLLRRACFELGSRCLLRARHRFWHGRGRCGHASCECSHRRCRLCCFCRRCIAAWAPSS